MEPLPKTEEILKRIAAGESLRAICVNDAERKAFTRRVDSDVDGLASRYARACADRIDSIVEDTLVIADDESLDPQSRRVRIDTRKWFASRLRPDKYGDRTQIEHSGAGGEPLTVTVRYTEQPPKSDAGS